MALDIETIGVGVDTSGARRGERDLDSFGRAANKASRDADKLTNAAKKNDESFKGATASLSKFAAQLGLGYAAINFTRQVIDVELRMQKLTNTLTFATGSLASAKKEMEFIRSTAQKLGLDMVSSATAFSKFAAAANGTALQGQKTRDVFLAVAKASTVMGLSADETSGALLAISQMISKGTVSAEELRGQLGERLPGAFQVAARAMGVTTMELGKMLEQGQIVATDFLPKFAAELEKTLGDNPDSAAQSAQAQLNRLKNAWDEFKVATAESGVMTIVLKVAEGTTNALKWFDHFVFGKGELADLQRTQGMRENLAILKERRANLDSSIFASDAEKALLDKRIRDLERQLNPGMVNPNAVPGYTEAGSYVPSILQTSYGSGLATGGGYGSGKRSTASASSKKSELSWYQDLLDQQAQMDYEQIMQVADYRLKMLKDEEEKKKKALEEEEKRKLEMLERLQDEANNNFEEAQRQAKAEARRFEQLMEKTFDNVSRALTDALLRGFENGKEFAQNFRDTLVNMFKTLVLQPIINFIVNPIAGAITAAVGSVIPGVAQASTGSLTGGLSLIDTIAKGNAGIISGIESLGAIIANGNGGILDAIGGFIGQYAGQIANILPFASAGLALLQGDVKGALFQGGGAAIGTLIGGPVGGIIGSFLGSALGGLFGEKVGQPDSFTSAVLDMATGKASINRLADNDGGNAKSSIDFTLQVAENFAKMVEALGGALHESGGFAPNFITRGRAGMMTFEMKDDEMTNPGTQFGSVSRIGRILVNPKDSEAVQERIADTYIRALKKFADLPEYLTRALDSYTENLNDKMGDETSASNFLDFLLGLQTLRTSLEGMPELFQRLIPMVEQVTDRNKLAAMNGTVAMTEAFYALFYSDAEKFADATSQLQRAFDGLGVTMPDTRSAFREMVESFDLTTEAGFGMYSALVSLAPAMDAYYKELEKQRQAIDALLLSTDRFRTKVDYTRALRYSENGISLDMLPQFASGGDFGGGVRLVGENGPEIEATGPSRIISTQEIMSRLRDPQANSHALIAEIKMLRTELRAANIAAVKASQKTAKLLDQFDKDGMPPTRV